MEQAEARELKQGFGDAAAAAFELAVTPAIFGVLGWLLDRQLGTSPIFTSGSPSLVAAESERTRY